MAENEAAAIRDGRFYATGNVLRKAPRHTTNADGSTSIAMGFPVATLDEFVDEDFAGEIAACLNVHDDMVAALRGFKLKADAIVSSQGDTITLRVPIKAIQDAAAALAKAEGVS